MSKFRQFILLTGFFLFSATSYAQTIDFGAEFVFTNDKMIAQTHSPTQIVTEEGLQKFRQWVEKVKQHCQNGGGCETKKGTVKGNESLQITFQDGFWIEISPDPSVLEVTMRKGNLADYESQKDRIEALVFGMARELGLYVHDRIGGGHITVDLETAFRGDAKLFRNFLVDYANHPELAWGVLGNHLGNAPPISALSRESKEAFYNVIREFDRKPTDIQTLANTINKRVYTSNPNDWQTYQHYQAVRLDQKGRMELRGFAPQKSIEAFELLISLIEKRIVFLAKQNHPVELQLAKSEKMSPAERMGRAQSYFQEMGLDIEDYKSVVIADHRDVQPAPELRPLAENMNSMGEATRPYFGVDLLYSQISEQDHKNFKEKSTTLSGGERYLVPYPKMISEDEKDTLVKGTEQRGRALMAFLRDLQGKRDFLTSGRLDAKILERILINNGTTWDAIQHRMTDSMGFIYAPDVVKHSDGNYVILEDNVSGNTGGLGDAKQAREDFLELMPEFKVLLNTNGGEGFAKRAHQLLSKHAGGKAVVMLMPQSQVAFNQFYTKQLTGAGIYVVPKDAPNVKLNMTVKQPILNIIENEKVSRTVEVGAVFHRGYGTDFRTEFPNTFKAGVEGRIQYVGYAAFDFLGDKELSPYVEEMVRFYLKEEPTLRFAQTVALSKVNERGRTVADQAQLEKIFSQLERWVIKDTTGLQGKGVWIGQFVKEKEKLLAYVKENPGAFVAQEYIPVSRINRWISDIRIHSMVLGNESVASDVFWGRAVSIFDNGKLNTHQNAGAIPIFVEGRDTLPDADRKAMHELFLSRDFSSVIEALDQLLKNTDPRMQTVINEWYTQRKDIVSKFQVKMTAKERKRFVDTIAKLQNFADVRAGIWGVFIRSIKAQLQQVKTAKEYFVILNSLKGLPQTTIRSLGYETKAQFERLTPTQQQREQWISTTGNLMVRAAWQRQGLLPNPNVPARTAPSAAGIRCELVYH